MFRVAVAGSADAPRTYTVEGGKKLDDSWSTVAANGIYDLVVTGPGAFYRHFAGDAKAAAAKASIAPEVRAEHDGFAGDCLRLRLSNEGETSVRLTLAANAYSKQPARHYRLSPGEVIEDSWSVDETYGWYDLSVTCDSSAAFLRRLAGRVENGKPRLSDPATA